MSSLRIRLRGTDIYFRTRDGFVLDQPPILRRVGIRDVKLGTDVVITEPVNLSECVIGDNTYIGPFVEIQKDVTIGKNCRILSHNFICERVSIGYNCSVFHGAMFINDAQVMGGPHGDNSGSAKSARVGDNVSIGTNATIFPVIIADHVIIAPGSVVTEDILESGLYAGNPARKVGDPVKSNFEENRV